MRRSIRQAAIYDGYVDYLRDQHGGSLVSHWPLDEPPGSTTATDVVGGYDGTHNGGVALGHGGVIRGLGASVRYDGSTGYTDVGDQSAHDIGASDSVTILMWTRFTEPSVSAVTPLAKWTGGAGPIIDLRDGHEIRIRLEDGQGDVVSGVVSGVEYSDRHLLSLVIDRGSDEMHVYQDDTLMTISTNSISAIDDMSSTAPLNFGRRSDGANYANGALGHISWVDKAMTGDEIAELARQGRQGALR
jgi:hypothetical protein